MGSTSGHSASLVTTPQQFPRCTPLNPPRERKIYGLRRAEKAARSPSVGFFSSLLRRSSPTHTSGWSYVVLPAPIGSDKSHPSSWARLGGGPLRCIRSCRQDGVPGSFFFSAHARHVWKEGMNPDAAQLAGCWGSSTSEYDGREEEKFLAHLEEAGASPQIGSRVSLVRYVF